MKKKDISSIAKRIAKCELALQTEQDPKKISCLKEEIMELTRKAESLEDLMAIDIAVQEILSKT